MSADRHCGKTPRRATDLWRRYPDGSAALLNFAGEITRLNATAFVIWQLADGRRTVEEIAAASAETFGRPTPELFADVVEALDEMERRRILVVDWRPL